MTNRLNMLASWLLVIAVMLIAALPARATGDLGNSGKFIGWWELGGYYGTDDSSRGEAVLFTPLMQSATTLFFLDARGKLFEEDVQEANIALGYRQMMASGWNFGIWGGWDVRDTTNDNTFNQISFGVEALSERFDLRVNGYVPVTDPKLSPSTAEVVLQANNIFLIGSEEVALHGVDGEVGMLLFGRNHGGGGGLKGAPAPSRRHELRGYVGGFWFDDDDALEEVAGPKGRLEYRINDVISSLPGSRLTIESELSHDDVRDTRFEIGARLRIPFGARGSDAASRVAALSGQELRMIEGLERDTDIITTQSKEENVIDNATNVAMNAVSFASNANQFANAVDKGGNRLIILQRNGAQIDVSGTDGQQLKKNQTVQGGASTIYMRGAKTGVVAPFTAPGRRPTIFTDDGNMNTGAITLASNTHVAGVNFRGVGGIDVTNTNGNRAIYSLGNLNNIVLEQLDVRELGDDAIRFEENNSNIKFLYSTVANVSADGIEFENFQRNVTIMNVDFRKTDVEAIDFVSGGHDNVLISNVTIDTVNNDAIEIGSGSEPLNTNFVLENIEISNISTDSGIEMGGTEARLSNITIRNVFDESAIRIQPGNSRITFENITVLGQIGGDVLEVSNPDNILNGAFDATGANVGGDLCNTSAGGGAFTGTVVINGQAFVDGAGCN